VHERGSSFSGVAPYALDPENADRLREISLRMLASPSSPGARGTLESSPGAPRGRYSATLTIWSPSAVQMRFPDLLVEPSLVDIVTLSRFASAVVTDRS
jgi:hypothetical protein